MGTNPITVTARTSGKSMTETIKPDDSKFFNSWFTDIKGFEWEAGGSKWTAPLEVKALQTEGRLTLEQNGSYTFKSCPVCKELQGKAALITSTQAPVSSKPEKPAATQGLQPQTPATPVVEKEAKTAPTSPVEPVAISNIPTPPVPPKPPLAKSASTESQSTLQKQIEKGVSLKKVEPPVAESKESALLKEIEARKSLTPVEARQLPPKKEKPKSPREKLLEDIQKKSSLKKVEAPEQKKFEHEAVDPLKKAIEARRLQIEQTKKKQMDVESDPWKD